MHSSADKIDPAILIHVGSFKRDQMSRSVREIVSDEIHFALVLEPDHALRFLLFP